MKPADENGSTSRKKKTRSEENSSPRNLLHQLQRAWRFKTPPCAPESAETSKIPNSTQTSALISTIPFPLTALSANRFARGEATTFTTATFHIDQVRTYKTR